MSTEVETVVIPIAGGAASGCDTEDECPQKGARSPNAIPTSDTEEECQKREAPRQNAESSPEPADVPASDDAKCQQEKQETPKTASPSDVREGDQMEKQGKDPQQESPPDPHQHDEHQAQSLDEKYVAFIADNPGKSFGMACCFCFPFCCTMIALATVVSGGAYFTMALPFYVKGHIRYERQDALTQAKIEASAVPAGFHSDSQVRTRELNAYSLQILYEAPEGRNVFDKEFMQKIAEIEQKILQGSGDNAEGSTLSYSDYCQLAYSRTGQPLNPESPCRNPMSILGFMSKNWIPLPYPDFDGLGSPAPPAMWVDPNNADLAKCTVVPRAQSWAAANANNANNSALSLLFGDMLPSSLSPAEFSAKYNAGQVCQLANIVMPGLTCDEFKTCFPLMVNLVLMTTWGNALNSQWDYSAAGADFDANFGAFRDYWSTYGGPITETTPYNLSLGVYAPYVYGVVLEKEGSTRRALVPKVFANAIRGVVDSSFGYPLGNGGKTGKAFMSTFYFGGPVTNVNSKWTAVPASVDCDENTGECAEETDVITFMYNAYNQMLLDIAYDKPAGLTMTWQSKDVFNGGDPLAGMYTQAILPQDMMFLVLAVAFVWGYMAFMKRSIFLASFAMIMIGGSVIPTVVLYQLIFQQRYIGILNVLSMFIIMGIGADDVFVLLDCYEADRDLRRPLKHDLHHAWRHAAKAMLCTSSTTFFSFLSNAISIFPAIQTFGLWCSCLIVVNYCSVNLYYLCVVSVYDKYLAKRQMICCGLKEKPLTDDTVQEVAIGDEKQETAHEEEFKGLSAWLADKYFPVINKFKIPLAILWLLFFIMYIVFAAHLKPDPNTPQTLPDHDPYQQFTPKLVEHFGALQNPYRISVDIVMGIDAENPINREGTESVKVQDRGTVNFAEMAGLPDDQYVRMQQWLTDETDGLCPALRSKYGDSSLKVATPEQLNYRDPVSCPWTDLKEFVLKNGDAWPRPTMQALGDSVGQHMSAPYPQDASKTNFEVVWGDKVFFKQNAQGVEVKFFVISVTLSAEMQMEFSEGNELWDAWNSFVSEWAAKAPDFLKANTYFTDGGAFHYFKLQETIISECFTGIGLSLALAFVVLIIATQNFWMAFVSICMIGSIVCSVITFAFWCGWKLGLMESVIFVMVIGLSVDYVVHMADAFLEAKATDREARARSMVGKMGLSVLSGAITSIGSSLMMCFTYIEFFKKFGLIILWTIFQSLLTAMVFFTAIMALAGPSGDFGNIGVCFAQLKAQVQGTSATSEGQSEQGQEKGDTEGGVKDV